MYRSWLRRALALLIILGPNIGLSEPSFPPRDALSPSKKKASGAARDVDELVISNRSGRRGSITFKPITKGRLIELAESALQSGARGKKNKKVKDFLDVLRSDQPITAPSDGSKEGARGKDAKPAKISQKRYFKELNQLERRANQLGFSLLDNPGQDEVFESRFATDSASFKAQAQSARDQAVPGASPLKFPKRPLFSDVKVKSGARGGQSHLRLLPKERIYTVGAKSTGGARGGAKAAREYKPKKISRSAKFGSKKLARAGIDHWLQPKASEDALRVQTETAVNIHLFGVKASIAKATADFRVDTQKERVSGKVTAFVLGKEKVLLNQSKVKVTRGSTFQKGDRWSREDSTSTKIRFQLGPVPCTVEVGAAFRAGIEYRVAMTPAAISMETIPYVNADAFARFAVDIFVASAGIRGDVVLIDGELRTVGELGLAKDGKDKLIAYSFFSGERGLETLSGSLSAFVKVGVGWFSKTFKHKIFGWKGFRQAQQLYKIQKSKIRLKRTKEVTRWVDENEPRAKVNRSPVQGNRKKWGKRGDTGTCPPGSHAYAVRQKITPKQGKGYKGKKDDYGLTGINLRCRTPSGIKTKLIWSEVMGKGQWSDWASCPKGEAIKSFRIKIQSPQGKKKDDTAANEVEFKCGDGTVLNPTVPKAGRWGTWRTGQSCEKSGRVDRFWVYIEHEQGKKDDTGINGLGVECKAFSRSKKTSLVCPKGSTLEGEKCRSATVKTSVFKANCGRNGQCSCGITSSGPGKFRVNCFSSSCPSGWKKRTISLRKGGGKKKKKTVCSREVSFRGADRCISTGYNEKTKSSRAQFHWRHECNHWISTADDAIYTFPGDG